jgi:hypothetical protein
MPNIFLDIASKLERLTKKVYDGPAQGLQTYESDNLLKTCQGPYKHVSKSYGALGTDAILPAKKGVRYFIHSYQASWIHDGTAAYSACSCVIDGTTTYLYQHGISAPEASMPNKSGVVDILTDSNTAVNMTQLTAAVTFHRCSLAYAEVQD